MKHKDEYLFKGGVFCPWCRSDQIEGGDIDINRGIASQKMDCLECDKAWTDVYKLVEVREE